jgi:HEAT repeat protein
MPTAAAAVPPLVEFLSGDDPLPAVEALCQFKRLAAPALRRLTELLTTGRDAGLRWAAAKAIGKIGPDSLPAVPVLITALGDPDPLVREHAAEALGDIGPSAAPQAVGPLAKVLTDSDARVRRDAVRSLGQMGPAAKAVLPAVAKMLKDPEQRVRVAAGRSVRQIDPNGTWPPEEKANRR